MEKKRSIEIIGIALFAIIWGGWRLVQNIGVVSHGLSNFSQIVSKMGPFSLLYISLYALLFIGLFIGGIAVLFLKNQGRLLIQGCLIIDILVRLYGIITTFPFAFTIAKMTGVSLMRVYFHQWEILPIDLIVLYFINRPKIKEQFK